ncbi:MAG: tetratricopeptide repeat protein [Deltaproteobacteria bacterium]|nr:tetratricopeptide repeat protein [Deltaproteobacteria bacterium]
MTRELRTTSRILLLSSVLLPGVAVAAPDPAEQKAFRDTAERYRERMGEFQADVRAIVDATEAEERRRITSAFGAAMGRVEEDGSTLRRVAITKLESFLSRHPATRYSADLKFRLADLYFEEAELDFLSRMDEYSRMEEQLGTDAGATFPEPPVKDYRKAVQLYRDIIDNHVDYQYLAETYYMLGWCLSAANAAQFDETAARDVWLVLAQKYPKSRVSNDATMRLGEYYFDLPAPREDRTLNLRTAVTYYERVLADGPEGRNYDKAIYKLGWTHFRLLNYEKSLEYLVTLLDYSDEQFAKTGRTSDMRKEAVEYLAISYSDMADKFGKKPVDVARQHLAKVGDKKWEHDVIERLAQILLAQAKFEDSVETYRYLQTEWPIHPQNPIYQYEIARIYAEKMPAPMRKPDQAAAALAELGEKYVEGKPWYNANRNNPDAVGAARRFVESSLADVATEYLLRAKESGQVSDFALAAARYRDFLAKYPFADDYDTYEWYLAYALFSANQFDEASGVYQQILKNERSQFREGARYQLMKSREEIARARYGMLEDLPQGAIVQNAITTPAGMTITQYMISDEQKAFVESADDLVDREFSDPEWAQVLDRDRAALAYLTSEIYYNHGYYDEARKRFKAVGLRFKGSKEAKYAADLMCQTFQNEGDLPQLQACLRTVIDTGTDIAVGGATTAAEKYEQVTLELCRQKTDDDRTGAAACYQDFLAQFPRSKYRDVALYNAANNLDLSGQQDTANRLFEQFINEFPSHERAKSLYFRIAQGYSSVLDLDTAVKYFEALPKLDPAHPDAPAALYNAAFLRTGMGDHTGAANAYMKYANLPNVADAENIYWRAGEQWELVGDREAADFYDKYLRRFGVENASHAIEAHYKLAKLYEQKGDSRRAAAKWSEIETVFRDNVARGVSSDARKMAAEGPLAQLLSKFESFKLYKFVNSEKTNVELVLQKKPQELQALVDGALALIQAYQDYDSAAAALYVQGMAYLAYADMVYAVPPPPGFTDDEIVIYQEQLDPFRLQAEDRGKGRLIAALEKAKADKRWSEWNSKALAALHDRYPIEYPSERTESRGGVPTGGIPFSGPASLPAGDAR